MKRTEPDGKGRQGMQMRAYYSRDRNSKRSRVKVFLSYFVEKELLDNKETRYGDFCNKFLCNKTTLLLVNIVVISAERLLLLTEHQ